MTKCEYPNCTCSPLRFAWLKNVSGQLGVFWLNKQRKIKIYPCGETERTEMPHDYRSRADVPGKPESPSDAEKRFNKNPVPVGATGIPDERKPELLRYLDDMSYLEKELWGSLSNLEAKVGPLLRKPQDSTGSNEIAEITPTTTVTSMIHDHLRSMRMMVARVDDLLNRLEV